MNPIYMHSNQKEFGFDSFKGEILSICKKHHEEKRALAFAFIIYDFAQPQFSQLLENHHYFNALNEISGQYLTIFSLHTKGKYKKSKAPAKETGEIIQKYFVNGSKIHYPSILFFQVENEQVVESMFIELEKETIEAAFIELKKIVNTAVDVLKQVESESKQDYNEIFKSIEQKLNKDELNVSVSKIIKKTISIKNVVGIIGFLADIKGLFF